MQITALSYFSEVRGGTYIIAWTKWDSRSVGTMNLYLNNTLGLADYRNGVKKDENVNNWIRDHLRLMTIDIDDPRFAYDYRSELFASKEIVRHEENGIPKGSPMTHIELEYMADLISAEEDRWISVIKEIGTLAARTKVMDEEVLKACNTLRKRCFKKKGQTYELREDYAIAYAVQHSMTLDFSDVPPENWRDVITEVRSRIEKILDYAKMKDTNHELDEQFKEKMADPKA